MDTTNRRSRLAAVGAVGVIAALVLAGCSTAADEAATGNTPGSAGASGSMSLSVANLPIADQGSYFYALDNGLFEKRGLQIKQSTAAGGSAAIAAMVSGDYDVAYSGADGAIKSFANTIPVKIISGANLNQPEGDEDATGLVAAKGITKVSQLAGAKIATNALGNINQVFAQEFLAQKGVTNVQVVEIPFPEQVAALESGQIQATLLPEPFASQAKANGATVLGYPYRFGEDGTTAVGVFVASDEAIKEKAAALKEFVAAMDEASQAANKEENREAVVKAILGHTKLSSEVAGAMTFVEFTTDVTPEGIQEVADLLQKYDILKQKVDVKPLVTPLG